MAHQKKFFGKLFDFSFSEFVAVQIIGVLYILGLVVIGFAAIAIVIGGFLQSSWHGLGALIVAPLFFLLYAIIVRVSLEGFVASIRTAENTQRIVDYLRRRNP